MKSVVLLLIIVTLAMGKHAHHKSKHHKKKQVSFNDLTPTPKGPGLAKAKSISLTQDDPNKFKVFTVDSDGNYILQALDKGSMNRVTTFCNRVNNPHDAFCAKIKECDICTMSSRCGWCEKSA